jgi:hypothetical protein
MFGALPTSATDVSYVSVNPRADLLVMSFPFLTGKNAVFIRAITVLEEIPQTCLNALLKEENLGFQR